MRKAGAVPALTWRGGFRLDKAEPSFLLVVEGWRRKAAFGMYVQSTCGSGLWREEAIWEAKLGVRDRDKRGIGMSSVWKGILLEKLIHC